MNSFRKILTLSYFGLLCASCTGIKNSQYYEYLSTTTEQAECLENYSYASSIKLTGTAKFFKRGLNIVTAYNSTTSKTELKNLILGDPLNTALPIRYAEIVVYNSKNQIVQCGRTDDAGNLKALDSYSDLLLPKSLETYSVTVLSRTHIQFSPVSQPAKPVFSLNVSVKQDKYTNKLYALTKNISSNGIDDLSLDLVAYARQTESIEINGGAFNILNSIFTAYSYISENTGTVNTQCLNKKIDTYWKAGFNPFQYLFPNENPSKLASNSYYNASGDKSLNITGGRLGNTSIENTDHFDDYVIIHELAHFIEDNCGQLTSPGGEHAIISRIDPRLAWAEGWANYLAAQVMYNRISEINPEFENSMVSAGFTSTTDRKFSFLTTTYGFSDSLLNVGNGSGVMMDLKKPGNNPDSWQAGIYLGSSFDKIDATRYVSEGHFREGAITRGFFKLSNACGPTCVSVPVSFEKIWSSFDNLTGAGQSYIKFKGSHHVLEKLKTFLSATWAGSYQPTAESEALHLYTDNLYPSGLVDKWIPYAKPLTTLQNFSCAKEAHIQPRSDDPILSGTSSDQRYSNHYYLLDMNLFPSVGEIDVSFLEVPGGTATEFDILLFTEDYIYNLDYACTNTDSSGKCLTGFVPSRTTNSTIIRSDRRSGSTISIKKLYQLSSLDLSKKYLLNIRAYTPTKTISSVTEYSYSITDGGGNYICP